MHLSPGLLVSSSPNQHIGSHHKGAAAPVARSVLLRWLVVMALALGAWAGSALLHLAHASPFGWSVGVQAPGAVVQVTNMPQPVVLVRPQVYATAPQVVWVDQWGNPIRQAYPQPQPQPHRYGGEEHSRRHHGHREHYAYRERGLHGQPSWEHNRR